MGESLSILPLVEKLSQEEKVKKILITTITLSSAEVLQKKLFENNKIVHQYLPLDVPNYINKFLNHWSPNLCILVDSEIWPNLIYYTKKKNIPLILINGRITKKSFSRWKIFKNFSRKIFGKFDLCIVANNETEKYLKILGAKNIKNHGNLKFSNTKTKLKNNLDINLAKKLEGKKIWCAASTHQNEEVFCAKAHLEIKKTFKSALMIIIPRHINRVENIKKELNKLNLKVELYSNLNQSDLNIDILLVDAYGESLKFFNISKFVFLGGSLIEHGGQNPLEPARSGCKIFHGPNINNFSDIYEYLYQIGISNLIVEHKNLAQSLVEDFKNGKKNNTEIVEKIDNYGQKILNNVIKDINIYINTQK